MAEIEKNRIRTNAEKEQEILNIFYRENFRKKDRSLLEQYIVSKVNLAQNETVATAAIASASDYPNYVSQKKTKTVTSQSIKIGQNETGFNLLFYSGTNYYDKSNPQNGRKDNLTRCLIRHQLEKVSHLGRTHIIFGGDLLGNEWEIKYLRNASIIDGKIYYFGINKRKERLASDIKTYLSIAESLKIKNVDIYLMRGAQEHKIQKELGRDILQEVVDELALPNVHYIDEGVSLGMNVTKAGNDKLYGIMGLQTNQTGKATTVRGANNSAIRDNGTLNADLIFRCNSNIVGKINGEQIYNVSSQSTYVRTPRMQKPEFHAGFYDVFWVNLEGNNEFSVVDGGINIFDNNLALEKKVYENKIKNELLLKHCMQMIDKDLYNTMQEEEKTQ